MLFRSVAHILVGELMLNGLDLFSGIGGISEALCDWVQPVAYCEIERHARAILLSRMEKSEIPNAPIWDDVRTLPVGQFRGGVDIISGGFPCQDISTAGLGKGLEGERSGLFFEIMRLTDELRPKFIFLENVSAITFRGLREVTGEITKRGYDSRWTTLRASEVGAKHHRSRWWLLAYSNGSGRQIGLPERKKEGLSTFRNRNKNAKKYSCFSEDEPESLLGGVVNGIPYKQHRVKHLGNAVVPQCAHEAFKILMGLS